MHGSDSFSYTVSDRNGHSATAMVDIEVTPLNDTPVANAQALRPMKTPQKELPFPALMLTAMP
jgi:hypothetical protein